MGFFVKQAGEKLPKEVILFTSLIKGNSLKTKVVEHTYDIYTIPF